MREMQHHYLDHCLSDASCQEGVVVVGPPIVWPTCTDRLFYDNSFFLGNFWYQADARELDRQLAQDRVRGLIGCWSFWAQMALLACTYRLVYGVTLVLL